LALGIVAALVLGLGSSFALYANTDGPSGPCAEGLSLSSRTERIEQAIAASQKGVTTKTGTFENVRLVYDSELDTARYQSVFGRVPEGSRVIVPLYHGGGTMKSHSHAMIQPMHVMTAKAARKSQLMTFLQQMPSRLSMAAEAIDAPGHGFGPSTERFPQLDNLVEWLATHIRQLKAAGLPVIPLTRSASTGYFLELHRRYPDLLDGLIMMSPVDPGIGLRVGLEALHHQAAEGRLVINGPGLEFVKSMYGQMDWSNLKPALKGLPILVLVGGRDAETPPETRQLFEQLIEGSHPLSRLVLEPTAGHEVLTVLDKEIGLRSFGAVQNFIFEIVKDFEARRSQP
jgi:hypothetical protein